MSSLAQESGEVTFSGSVQTSQRIIMGLIMIVYGLTFLYSIEYIIMPIWGYFGLDFNLKPAPEVFALGVMALLPVAWLPITLRRPSESLSWGLYILTYVPTILYGMGSNLTFWHSMVMSVSLLVGLVTLTVVPMFPLLRIPRLNLSPSQFWWGLWGVTILFYGLALWSCGISFEFADLDEMYQQRADFVDTVRFPANYAILWQSCVINPFLMAYGLCRKKPWLFALGAVGQMYFYGLSAAKALVASIALILLLAVTLRDQGLRFGLRWSGLITLGCFVPAAVTLFVEVGPLIQAVVGAVHWRTLVETSFLSNLYFDYFSNHPLVMFSEVKGISLFLHSPYVENYTFVIGDEFFGNMGAPSTPQANVNLWADGFANLSVLGVFIESAIAAFIFWLIDSLSAHLSPKFVAMAVGYQLLTLTNGSVITGILSQGLAIFVVLIYLAPAEPGIAASDLSSTPVET